jgi:acyl-CoA synthetase (AMP-forming)/AMP-acid ligase II
MAIEIGPEQSINELLDRRAAARPDAIALIASSLVTGAEEHVSYATLRSDSCALAAALAHAGVGAGDRVAILLTNEAGVECHVAYHAAHWLGAIGVPLNTRYVARELNYVIEFIAASAIVFESRFSDVLRGLLAERSGLALIEVSPTPSLGVSFSEFTFAPGAEPAFASIDPEQDADWVFTSGTTGNPKAIALSHRSSVACGYQSINMLGLDGDSVVQAFSPFFTSASCRTHVLGCLAAGCTNYIEPEFDVRGTLDRMVEHGTTSVFLISTVLQLIMDRLTPEELDAYRFPALRRIIYGAQAQNAAFFHRVWKEIGERWGVEMHNIYGLSEGGTSGTMLSHAEHPAALERMGPYGLSIGREGFAPWVQFTILDPDDQPVAPGVVGQLCLRGPSTMSRYVGHEEATEAALRHGWLHTGDMATIDEDGFIYYVDREKQLIRRAGMNISSAEVEGVILEHAGVAEVAVVPLPNPVLEEDVRAVVVLRGDSPPTPEELIAFCAERLADYKVPRQVDIVDALPRNAMNRVMKGVLTGKGGALE